MLKPNMLVHTCLCGRLFNVVADSGPIAERLFGQPGFGPITECVHIAVRANTWVAKKIPGTSDGTATLQ